MSDQKVFLDDIYSNEQCQGSVFRAVVMMSHEARFINEQARMGYINLQSKPTTIAMYKFKENRLKFSLKDANLEAKLKDITQFSELSSDF